MNGNVSRAVKWMCQDRCEKPLELSFSDTDFVSELTQRQVLGGATIVEPEIRQLCPRDWTEFSYDSILRLDRCAVQFNPTAQ